MKRSMSVLRTTMLCALVLACVLGAQQASDASPKAACTVLPASQAERILGLAVKAVDMKSTGNVPGTTGSICDYVSQQKGPVARLTVITAASPAAAASAMRAMSAEGLPAWAMAQKGASFLQAGAGDPPDRKKIKQMLAAGTKRL